MDLSRDTRLAGLARAIAPVHKAALELECPIFLAGAIARDLWLEFGFGIEPERRTEDIDIAVRCADWGSFERLADELRAQGLQQAGISPHRFRSEDGDEIDLIPFGGLESPDRTVAWPPDHDRVMNLLGFAEAAAATELVQLPGNLDVPVVSQHGLALLKLIAWEDRRRQAIHKDAQDLHVVGKTYLRTRVPAVTEEEQAELLESYGFEDSLAGASLLGSDMATLGSTQVREVVTAILRRESEPDGSLAMARDIGTYDIADSLAFISAIHAGYASSGHSHR